MVTRGVDLRARAGLASQRRCVEWSVKWRCGRRAPSKWSRSGRGERSVGVWTWYCSQPLCRGVAVTEVGEAEAVGAADMVSHGQRQYDQAQRTSVGAAETLLCLCPHPRQRCGRADELGGTADSHCAGLGCVEWAEERSGQRRVEWSGVAVC